MEPIAHRDLDHDKYGTFSGSESGKVKSSFTKVVINETSRIISMLSVSSRFKYKTKLKVLRKKGDNFEDSESFLIDGEERFEDS